MRITKTGEPTVRAAIERGDIPSIRVGRNVRIPSAPIRALLGIEA